MKTYDGTLILEPEDTYAQPISATESRLAMRGNNWKPVMNANTVIAKTNTGYLVCLKSRERDPNSYTQVELQKIVDLCENPIDVHLLLML